MASAVQDRARKFRVTFARIGRDHGLSGDGIAADFEATDQWDLSEKIYRWVRKRGGIGSKELEVYVNLQDMKGSLVVGGFQNAGEFTIKEEK
jgi:hypothetical protein